MARSLSHVVASAAAVVLCARTAAGQENMTVHLSSYFDCSGVSCPVLQRTKTVYPEIHTSSCNDSCAPYDDPPACFPGTMTVTPRVGSCAEPGQAPFLEKTASFAISAPVQNCGGQYEWIIPQGLNYKGCEANVTFKTSDGDVAVSFIDVAPVDDKPNRVSNFDCPGIEGKSLRETVECTANSFWYDTHNLSLANVDDTQGVDFDAIDGSGATNVSWHTGNSGWTNSLSFTYTLPTQRVDELRINSSVSFVSSSGNTYNDDYYVETLLSKSPPFPNLQPSSLSVVTCEADRADEMTHYCSIQCYDDVGEVLAPHPHSDVFKMSAVANACLSVRITDLYSSFGSIAFFNLTYIGQPCGRNVTLMLNVSTGGSLLLTKDPSTQELKHEPVQLTDVLDPTVPTPPPHTATPPADTAMPSTPPPDTAMPSNNTAKPSTPSPDTAMPSNNTANPSTPSPDTAMPS
ncbi:hypothetical protein DIPPA_51430, partial [Diplonema papillatum]